MDRLSEAALRHREASIEDFPSTPCAVCPVRARTRVRERQSRPAQAATAMPGMTGHRTHDTMHFIRTESHCFEERSKSRNNICGHSKSLMVTKTSKTDSKVVTMRIMATLQAVIAIAIVLSGHTRL